MKANWKDYLLVGSVVFVILLGYSGYLYYTHHADKTDVSFLYHQKAYDRTIDSLSKQKTLTVQESEWMAVSYAHVGRFEEGQKWLADAFKYGNLEQGAFLRAQNLYLEHNTQDVAKQIRIYQSIVNSAVSQDKKQIYAIRFARLMADYPVSQQMVIDGMKTLIAYAKTNKGSQDVLNYVALAQMSLHIKDTALGMKFIEQARKLDERNVKAMEIQSELFYADKKTTEALRNIEQTLQVDEKSVESLYLKGRILEDRQDVNAMTHYQQAIYFDPSHLQSNLALSEFYMRQKQKVKANECLLNIIKYHPKTDAAKQAEQLLTKNNAVFVSQ